MSYGTGRPAILKDDDSIADARRIIDHPLRVADDIRLCSTLELMAIRERIHNKLSLDPAINEETFAILKKADQEFEDWLKEWDDTFNSFNYDGAGMALVQLLALTRLIFSKPSIVKAYRFRCIWPDCSIMLLH